MHRYVACDIGLMAWSLDSGDRGIMTVSFRVYSIIGHMVYFSALHYQYQSLLQPVAGPD